jgi:hypothetical protein
MDSRLVRATLVPAVLCACLIGASCTQVSGADCDEIVPFVYLEYGFGNILDGFSGTYTKDLVTEPDTTIALSLSERELWRILARADSIGFFSFPDTVHAHPDIDYVPNPGPDMLRLSVGDRDHTVVWYYPIDSSWPHWESLLDLSEFIQVLVKSKEPYMALPPPAGGYR